MKKLSDNKILALLGVITIVIGLGFFACSDDAGDGGNGDSSSSSSSVASSSSSSDSSSSSESSSSESSSSESSSSESSSSESSSSDSSSSDSSSSAAGEKLYVDDITITFNDAGSTVVHLTFEDTTGFNDVTQWETYNGLETYTASLYSGSSPAPPEGSKAMQINCDQALGSSQYIQTPYTGTKIPVPADATQATISGKIYDNTTYCKARFWTAMFNGGGGISEVNSFPDYTSDGTSWQTISGTVSWSVACDGMQFQIRCYSN